MWRRRAQGLATSLDTNTAMEDGSDHSIQRKLRGRQVSDGREILRSVCNVLTCVCVCVRESRQHSKERCTYSKQRVMTDHVSGLETVMGGPLNANACHKMIWFIWLR